MLKALSNLSLRVKPPKQPQSGSDVKGDTLGKSTGKRGLASPKDKAGSSFEEIKLHLGCFDVAETLGTGE